MKKGTSSTNELKSTGSSGAHSPSLLPSRALGHVGGGRFRWHATREVCILRQVP